MYGAAVQGSIKGGTFCEITQRLTEPEICFTIFGFFTCRLEDA